MNIRRGILGLSRRALAPLAFVCLFIVTFALCDDALGQAARARRSARAVASAAAAPAEALLQPILPAVETIVGVGVPSYVAPSIPRNDAALYDVGVQNLSWRSRQGVSYSAIAYYPKNPPVDGGKFSVAIFSHGLGSSAESFAYLGRAWASRGIVTILLKHPNSDESVWRGKLRPMAELRDAYAKYWPARDRAKAIIAAIDLLETSNNAPGPMGSDLDLTKIAVAGNDLGALAALLVAGQLPPDNGAPLKDSRVAAVLALSPPVFCDSSQAPRVYGGITVPLMVVSGTKDDGVVGTTKAYQRRIPFDGVSLADRYLVVLQGADHRVYGGLRISSQRQAADASFQETISVAASDFFSAYLMEDEARLEMLRARGAASPLQAATVERRLGTNVANASYSASRASRERR